MERINNEKIILILLATCLVLFIGGVAGKRVLTDSEVRSQLEHPNKLPVKTIKLESGDIIDCVDIYKQPTFDHPLLKNHTIQMRPSNCSSGNSKSLNPFKQVWNKSGSCPEGTIPILRIQNTNLFRMGSLEGQGENLDPPAMESAKLYVDHENLGGEADINVWSIYVEPGESSTASIFVGVEGQRDMINAGWIVAQGVCGDNKPRFYLYWASDNGACYNLKCPGFVHTSKSIYLCAELTPLSVYGGEQYIIHVKMYKDLQNGNWWLQFGDEPVGYWPSSLFRNMATSANIIQYGGQVWNSVPGGHHTNTQMGSGHFSKEGPRRAAYMEHCLFYNLENQIQIPTHFPSRATKPSCYDISSVGRGEQRPGAGFFYGGPGGAGCDGTN